MCFKTHLENKIPKVTPLNVSKKIFKNRPTRKILEILFLNQSHRLGVLVDPPGTKKIVSEGV